jgi:hypothetical protein
VRLASNYKPQQVPKETEFYAGPVTMDDDLARWGDRTIMNEICRGIIICGNEPWWEEPLHEVNQPECSFVIGKF